MTTREKNLYLFTVEENKTYKFDINTGLFYGLKGQPLKRVSAIVKKEMKAQDNIIFELFLMYLSNEPCEIYKTLDKILSLGVNPPSSVYYDLPQDLFLIEKNWKIYCKVYKETGEKHFVSLYNLFQKQLVFHQWEKELKNNILTENEKITFSTYFVDRDIPNEQERKIFVHYLTRENIIFLSLRSLLSKITDYLKMCKEIDYIPQKEKSFISEFAKVYQNYKIMKNLKINKTLQTNQLAHINALTFEHNNLIVVIPTTKEEFIDEANQQHNCVARCYIDEVVKNYTNIVFIRHKDDLQKSYITCEVHNGVVYQYRYKFNDVVVKEEDILFKELYQQHLNNNWSKSE